MHSRIHLVVLALCVSSTVLSDDASPEAAGDGGKSQEAFRRAALAALSR